MNFLSRLFFLFCLYLLVSCSGTSTVSNFEWMLGKWTATGYDSTVYDEIWKKESDKLMSGFSCGSIAPDTFFKENPKIEIVEGKAFYITSFPDIKGSVLFKSVIAEPNRALFQNEEYAFPAKIEYQLTGDSLLIRYEGTRQGKPAREELYFHKAK